MTSRLTATTSSRVFFQLLQFSRQRPSFSADKAAPMIKTDLIFLAFSSRFVDFAFNSALAVRFDSGVIFLDQSQFFATHSNQ